MGDAETRNDEWESKNGVSAAESVGKRGEEEEEEAGKMSVEEDEAQRRGDGDDRSDSEQLKVGFII